LRELAVYACHEYIRQLIYDSDDKYDAYGDSDAMTLTIS